MNKNPSALLPAIPIPVPTVQATTNRHHRVPPAAELNRVK
jgi:hypothetical protein